MLWAMNKYPFDSRPTIYVVDADPSVRALLTALFASLPNPVRTYGSAESFLGDVPSSANGCLVVELNLPGMDGLALMDQLRQRGINLPVIMLASASDVPTAVRAMQRGALDFIDKPFVERLLFNRVCQILAMTETSSSPQPATQTANVTGSSNAGLHH